MLKTKFKLGKIFEKYTLVNSDKLVYLLFGTPTLFSMTSLKLTRWKSLMFCREYRSTSLF